MTAQIHEILILEGERTTMDRCLSIPLRHPQVLIPYPARTHFMSSACWRGYQGTWAIDNGKLYLVDLQGRLQLSHRSRMESPL